VDQVTACVNDPGFRANANAVSLEATGRSVTLQALRDLCLGHDTTVTAIRSWFINRAIEGTLSKYGY
jgi:hypothetical protein